jgi:hypothetical protein
MSPPLSHFFGPKLRQLLHVLTYENWSVYSPKNGRVGEVRIYQLRITCIIHLFTKSVNYLVQGAIWHCRPLVCLKNRQGDLPRMNGGDSKE